MNGVEDSERRTVLGALLALRSPVDTVVAQVRALPWDTDTELVTLDRRVAASALVRYRSGELSADQLELWAETIEGRDDIGFETGHEELLKRLVFDLANPLLTQPLTVDYATSWLERMTPSA